MARVMIKCPRTGESVPTGVEMEREWFESLASTMTSSVLQRCPSCGEAHAWSKSVAFIDMDAGAAPA